MTCSPIGARLNLLYEWLVSSHAPLCIFKRQLVFIRFREAADNKSLHTRGPEKRFLLLEMIVDIQ